MRARTLDELDAWARLTPNEQDAITQKENAMTHKTYEVKAWVTVRAQGEADAVAKAAALLDLLPSDTLGQVALEGEGSVYETDES